jgi:hypothetical protein
MGGTPETSAANPTSNRPKSAYRTKFELAVELGCDLKTIDKVIVGKASQNRRTKALRIEVIRRGLAQNVTAEEQAIVDRAEREKQAQAQAQAKGRRKREAQPS